MHLFEFRGKGNVKNVVIGVHDKNRCAAANKALDIMIEYHGADKFNKRFTINHWKDEKIWLVGKDLAHAELVKDVG